MGGDGRENSVANRGPGPSPFMPALFSRRSIATKRWLKLTPRGAAGEGGNELRSVKHCPPADTDSSCFQGSSEWALACERCVVFWGAAFSFRRNSL